MSYDAREKYDDDDLIDDGEYITERQPDLTEEEAAELDRQVLLTVIGVIVFIGGIVFGIGSAVF